MINIPKGTKDVLPSQSHKWQYVEGLARKIARLYNAREIRTPAFEHTELFLRSNLGDDSDIVSKEMYTFTDKGGRSLTLKPEGTAPVARSFCENSLEQSEGLPLKMYYFTQAFRYDRPQAGRYREHHQFGVEFYGSASPLMDAEVISLAYDFLTELGLDDVSLQLNSIGCPKCRSEYNKALKRFLEAQMESLCSTCRTRYENNPLRILDCKVEGCKKIVEKSPKIIDCICDDCKEHMTVLKNGLDTLKIPYVINSDIVRGLDYYTKTVFEFTTNSLGAQGSVLAGGRYDNMTESIGGKSVPCVGFGAGIERLILLLENLNKEIGTVDNLDIYIAPLSENERNACTKIVSELRKNGISAETDFLSKSVKAQLKYANKINAKFVVVIGENEMISGKTDLKDMSTGSSQIVNIHDLSKILKSII